MKRLIGALIGLCLLPVLVVFKLDDMGARTRRELANARAHRIRRKRRAKVLKG